MSQREYKFLVDKRLYDNVPCQTNCPVHTDVEGYIALIAKGDFEGAHRLIRETNPFPSTCGRVCQHFCERDCTRQKVDKSVSIMSLKRAATDYSMKKIGFPDKVDGKLDKVAVIGAGPAGLTTAHDLALMGYRVTVFEALAESGGMLRYGIPAYRLPREIIDYEVEYIEKLGVEIQYNVRVGKDIGFDKLKKDYKAILIAAGAHKAVKMEIKGEELKGVYGGSTFMYMVNTGEEMPAMKGKVVGVIGGGFTAMDVSRSCIRLGAKKVYIIYRRTRDEIPVNEKEIHEAEEEGIIFRYLEAPLQILSDDDGSVSGVELIKNELGQPDESGRRRPKPIANSEFVLDLDYLVAAVSQSPETEILDKTTQLKRTSWGTIEVAKGTFVTSVPGIFSCGDFVTGTRDAINVIADGHTAAISMDAYLRDENAQYDHDMELEEEEESTPEKIPMYDGVRRVYPSTIPIESRTNTFDEVEETFTVQEAMEEASRCLKCGHSWAYESDSCILCMNCIDVCPQECLSMEPISELAHNRLFNENISLKKQQIAGIEIDRSECIRCTFCEQVCPSDSISFTCFSKEKEDGILQPVLKREKESLK
jgi:NADPH-dependent glutamate synthase beta subunit-like oxidoreductase